MEKLIHEINAYIDEKLKTNNPAVQPLYDAMRYTACGAGKRIRGTLCLLWCMEASGKTEPARAAAAAIELIHAFSLIHDDLPTLDNDDFRRKMPTNHRAFGQTVALLAGDGLLIEAFRIIVNDGITNNRIDSAMHALQIITTATGGDAMLGGQYIDISLREPDIELLNAIHKMKTETLLEASGKVGAIYGKGSPDVRKKAASFSQKLGELFQIVDDLLDQKSDQDPHLSVLHRRPSFPFLRGQAFSKKHVKDLQSQCADIVKDCRYASSFIALLNIVTDRISP